MRRRLSGARYRAALTRQPLARPRTLLLRAALLSSLLDGSILASALVGQAPPPIVVTDGDFDNYDWRTYATAHPSTRVIAYRTPDGGNLGAYRVMNFSLPPNTFVFSVHIHRAFAYDPEAQGPIDSIDLSADIRWLAGNESMQAGFALIQDGTIYVTAQGANAFESHIGSGDNQWTRRQRVRLTAQDFCPRFGTGACTRPDFEKTGGPIQFGYWRHHDNRRPLANQQSLSNGIDNWSLTVRPRELHCRVHYTPEGSVEEYFDGDTGTSGSSAHSVLISFDCPVRLRGFSRFMSSGALDPAQMVRPNGDHESIEFYTHPPYTRQADGFLSPTVAQGWDPYPYFQPSYNNLPYGWTPVLQPRAPVFVSALRYSWASGANTDVTGGFDLGDSLHEVEVTYDEVVGARPDLAITKHDSGDTVPASGYITYFLDYANQGTATAIDVVIKDPAWGLEEGDEARYWASGIEELSTPSGWKCTGGSPCRLELGDLPPGAHGTAELTVQILGGGRDVLNDVRIVQEPPPPVMGGRIPLAESRVDNNVATDATPESCDCNDPVETCCVLGWADCTGGGANATPAPATVDRGAPPEPRSGALRGLGARLVDRATSLFQTTGDLLLFYRVRDLVFASTPGGRRATSSTIGTTPRSWGSWSPTPSCARSASTRSPPGARSWPRSSMASTR